MVAYQEPNSKSRKKRLPPSNIEDVEQDLARREMDALLTSSWERQMSDLSGQVGELTRTVRGFNGTPGLCGRMERVEIVLNEISPKMDAIYEYFVADRAVKTATDKAANKAADEPEQKPLTLERLAALFFNEFFKPLLIMVMAWLILEFGPLALTVVKLHSP